MKKISWLCFLIILGLSIWMRQGWPTVPIADPDTWGYLNPALSWLSGNGFQQTHGRSWLYPALVSGFLSFGGGFSGIVSWQQCIGILSLLFLWIALCKWQQFLPSSLVVELVGTSLILLVMGLLALNPQILTFETELRPEALFQSCVLMQLACIIGFINARWHRPNKQGFLIFGPLVITLSYVNFLLKPSWGISLLLTILPVIIGLIDRKRKIQVLPQLSRDDANINPTCLQLISNIEVASNSNLSEKPASLCNKRSLTSQPSTQASQLLNSESSLLDRSSNQDSNLLDFTGFTSSFEKTASSAKASADKSAALRVPHFKFHKGSFALLAISASLIGILILLPSLLEWKRDSASITFLPLTLFSVHADVILESLKKQHPQTDSTNKSLYDDLIVALEKALKEAHNEPHSFRKLGFDADYIMYRSSIAWQLCNQQHWNDVKAAAFLKKLYFNAWLIKPFAMTTKIIRQLSLFVFPSPSTFYWANTKLPNDYRDSLSSLPTQLPTEYQSVKAIYSQYLETLSHPPRIIISPKRNNLLRDAALKFASFASTIQLLFFFCVSLTLLHPTFFERFSSMRLAIFSTLSIALATYGNALTIAMIHTLDINRYRLSYGPFFLIALGMMLITCLAMLQSIGTSTALATNCRILLEKLPTCLKKIFKNN